MHGYILVYSVTSKSSLEVVRTLNDRVSIQQYIATSKHITYLVVNVIIIVIYPPSFFILFDNSLILNACGTEKIPRVLVGNKSDLVLERLVFYYSCITTIISRLFNKFYALTSISIFVIFARSTRFYNTFNKFAVKINAHSVFKLTTPPPPPFFFSFGASCSYFLMQTN